MILETQGIEKFEEVYKYMRIYDRFIYLIEKDSQFHHESIVKIMNYYYSFLIIIKSTLISFFTSNKSLIRRVIDQITFQSNLLLDFISSTVTTLSEVFKIQSLQVFYS